MRFLIEVTRFAIRLIVENVYKFCSRAVNIVFFIRQTQVKVDYKDFVINKRSLYKKDRSIGISGMYRVRNEADLLALSVESHIDYLDEVVIVYNDCQDSTPKIAEELANKYKDKVYVYEYKPKVYPALSKEHLLTPSWSPHSLVNYYNYALAKTSKKIVVKIDADHIAISDKFHNAVERVKRWKNKKMLYFYGVNLFTSAEGELTVNSKAPFTAGYDCGFFPVVRGVYFTHRNNCESLHLPLLMYFTRRSLGVLFYHLKGVKVDRGVSSLEGLTSKQAQKVKNNLYNPLLISWREAQVKYPDLLNDIEDPNKVLSTGKKFFKR